MRPEEFFCKQILEQICGIPNIIVSDKPDLKSGNIGFEVTCAYPKDYNILWNNATLNVDENVLYVKSTLDKQAASVIEKYFPINPDDGTRECNNELFDCRLAVPKTVSCIKQTYESKISKVKGYCQMKELYLFIFCQPNQLFSVQDLDGLAQYFQSDNNFKKVIVFDEWVLYCFKNGQYNCRDCRDRLSTILVNTWRDISQTLAAEGF